VASLDVAKVRADFPLLSTTVRGGKPLVYLDNAASTQKPQAVIDSITRFYTKRYSNVHRGVHELSELATGDYEQTRDKLVTFLNAGCREEIIFTHGTTEAVNLVARGMDEQFKAGDEVLLSEMEHHSNIVPWQMLCERSGAVLRVAPIDDNGDILMDALEGLLNERTRMVVVSHTSNALGTRNPVERIAELAHAHGALVLLDGAQAAPHCPVDVQDLGCDFFVLSGHKMYGPTGVGVLWGRREELEKLSPLLGGGDMIETVTFEKTTYRGLPQRLEAGTPGIAGVIGLGAAVDYLDGVGMQRVAAHEHDLLEYGTERIQSIPGLRLIGSARRKAAILSFVVEGIHAHDLGTVLDLQGVAVRAGHHCAQPLMQRFGVVATVRASIAMYNTREDLDCLASGIHKAIEVFCE